MADDSREVAPDPCGGSTRKSFSQATERTISPHDKPLAMADPCELNENLFPFSAAELRVACLLRATGNQLGVSSPEERNVSTLSAICRRPARGVGLVQTSREFVA